MLGSPILKSLEPRCERTIPLAELSYPGKMALVDCKFTTRLLSVLSSSLEPYFLKSAFFKPKAFVIYLMAC
jgi:hypothetical protein